MANNFIRNENIVMNVVTFLLFVGGIAYWVIRQAQKNSEADSRRNLSVPPEPEISPDASPVSEPWGQTSSLDDLLNPIPYETEVKKESVRERRDLAEREADRSGRGYRPAGPSPFETERRQTKKHAGKGRDLYNPKRDKRFPQVQRETSRRTTDRKILESQKSSRWEEESRFGQEGERVSKDTHELYDRNHPFADAKTEDENFVIRTVEEVRKAIVWGEILQRKHF